ncbi:MAG: mechanosensitive ion channel domain-containing protein [Cyanobacteria bacterium P01_H01_bin.15]
MDYLRQVGRGWTAILAWLNGILFPLGDSTISLLGIVQLVLSLIILWIIAQALRNYLRRRLLRQFGLAPGSREAIANLIGYGLAILGFGVILQQVGLQVSTFAVLAGGLGIGIGFGLQDLTKNFVSGMTLLLERYVKIGDFVEFGNLEGYVKEISTRSTIIQTEEGGEVVVPNSQLAENQVVNWSYESYSARIHVPVQVQYGSNLVLVTEALLKAAYQEPSVLTQPKPRAMFMGFGDSGLNFELWIWVDRIDWRHEIRSSVNFLIEYYFRQYGIHIPFPQRDLWLRNPEMLRDEYVPPERVIVEQPQTIGSSLRKVTYFAQCNDLEIRRLVEVGSLRLLHEQEILFRQDDPGDSFFIVLTGSVAVRAEKLNKQLAVLETGTFFGELALMLGIPRTATVIARTETRLFELKKASFQQLLQQNAQFCEAITQALCDRKEELQARQQELRAQGLISLEEDDQNPLLWVRKRLNRLFQLNE